MITPPKTDSGGAARWRDSFLKSLDDYQVADSLRQAAVTEDLAKWTFLLTAVVVRSCGDLGWAVAAKGHSLALLPQPGQEYLGIDVMAFGARDALDHSQATWPVPLAVFELENSTQDDRVAYSLWKVLCVRARLQVVVAYRRTWEQATALPNRIAADVLPGFQETIGATSSDVVIVMGSRSEGGSFPWGYFKFWRLDHGVGRFIKLG